MSDLSRDELIAALRSGKKLEHMDLSAMDLRGIDFQRVNFSGSNLSGTKLNDNRLSEAIFTRADLSEAEMNGCKLDGAILEGAILRKTDLTDSNLSGARMARADLRGADLSRAILAEADLRGADLTRAKLSVTDFRRASLAGANLTGAMLRGALMRGADMRDAILDGAIGLEYEVPEAGATSQTTKSPILPRKTQAMTPEIALARRSEPATTRPTMAIPRASSTQVQTPVTPSSAAQSAVRTKPRAAKYHPPLRQIPSLIFTSSGWIRGQFHVPIMHGFLDFLNKMGELLKLTDVTLPHMKKELAFFGLRRDAALMLIPDCDEELLSLPTITGQFETHQTSFLMASGSVTGFMTIEADIRISDYLNQGRWVVLRDCQVGSHTTGASGKSSVAKFPLIILNSAGVIGTSDESLGI